MPAAANSSIALAMANLRTLLSQSPTFMARVGGDAGAALNKIHLQSYKLFPGPDNIDPLIALRPYAVIVCPAEMAWRQYAGGAQYWLKPQGQLVLYLADNSKFPLDQDDDAIDFLNFAGGCADDLATVSAQGSNLTMASIELVEPPAQPNYLLEQSQGLFWDCLFAIDWE